MAEATPRLTSLSHGGGCGCKLAPAVLADILATLPRTWDDPALLVGAETGDDAAVWRLAAHQALVATTDFFMPIVDDPHDFGRIAATNALSDIYAVGARPIFALAVVGMPIDILPVPVIRTILEGGNAVCRAAGAPVVGGHSIDAPEPIYGLAVLGLIAPERVKRNDGARPGDALVLGKALGVGVLSGALKAGDLDAAGYRELLATTTQLNAVGMELAAIEDVHAMTDVTGFGLLGHLLEMCRGAGLGGRIALDAVPVLPTARARFTRGRSTGAASRNWASYGEEVALAAAGPAWQRELLCDPQTSGGLLLACAPQARGRILDLFHARGFAEAAVIGNFQAGAPAVMVT